MSKGLIISNVSNEYEIETLDNSKIIKGIPRGKLKKNELIPVVGDRVEFEYENETTGIINKILDRTNYIKRPKMSNLTQMIFVLSMKMPKPDLLLLDKQLAFAKFNNINVVICINKIDLEEQENIDEIEKIYSSIGYSVIKTNAKTGEGINKILECLNNNITAFSGNSGVGKSTLINGIFKEKLTLEGDISSKNKRGKNTTTSIKLYKINENSYIADTPGFSTFDIYEIESEDLYKYFCEIEKHSKYCEFIGCTHIKEQTCGVKNALTNKLISKQRYKNYCRLYEELKEREMHKW